MPPAAPQPPSPGGPGARRAAALAVAVPLILAAFITLTLAAPSRSPAPARSPAQAAPSGSQQPPAVPAPSFARTAPGRPRPAPPGPAQLRRGGSDQLQAPTGDQRAGALRARRVAERFGRAWTRFTADPADRGAARAVRATVTPALWAQLRLVRPTAGAREAPDRYLRIAGAVAPLSGRAFEVVLVLRGAGGEREYLSVQAAPSETGWKITQVLV